MDKIFIQGFNDRTNVCVGHNFTNKVSYIIGYWEAGNILVDKAVKLAHPHKDRLFFPICNNYRQFIELILKQLIIYAEIVYIDCDYIGMLTKKYINKFSDKLNTTHNIEKLLNWLIIILNCITDEKISKNIIKLILEYHNMDTTGQKFRYPVSTKDIKHFETHEDFDLEKIKNSINFIGNYLMGIDAYIYELGNFVKTYIKEIENIYNYEYNHHEYYFSNHV